MKKITFFLGVILVGFFRNTYNLIQSSIFTTNATINSIVQDFTTIYTMGIFSNANNNPIGIANINPKEFSLLKFSFLNSQSNSIFPYLNFTWQLGCFYNINTLNNLFQPLPIKSIDTSFASTPNFLIYTHFIKVTTLHVGGVFT